ncbi:MAG: hypothetical protein AAB554_05610 [Patescibacteria group bacterium]
MTLSETLIAIGIFVVATGILTTAYVAQSRAYAKVRDRADLLSDGWIFERRFSGFARNASGIAVSRMVGGTALASGSGTVIFAMPAVDASGQALSDLLDYAAFRYDPAAGTVRLIVAPDAASARKAEDRTALRNARGGGFRYDEATADAANEVSFGFVLGVRSVDADVTSLIDGTYALGNR